MASKNIFYKTSIHEELHTIPDIVKLGFHAKVESVLSNDESWCKFFDIEFVPLEQLNECPDITCLNIVLSPESYIVDHCGFSGLSCYNRNNNRIYIHYKNWTNEDESFLKSVQQDIDGYRTYLVNHEVGHSLGLDHLKRRDYINKICPVMVQQTKGTEGTIANCWPTVADIRDTLRFIDGDFHLRNEWKN